MKETTAGPATFDPFAFDILPDTCNQPVSVTVVNSVPLSTDKPPQADNQHPARSFPLSPRKINDRELLERFNAGASGIELAAHFGCSPAAISKRLKRLAPGPPKAIDQLTTKQAAVVKRIVAGESAVNAVECCYDTTSRHSAHEVARKVMAVPGVQLAIEEEMNLAGLTRRYRVNKLAEHVEAADPGIALKALDMSFKLADDFPAIKSKSQVIHWVASPVDLSRYT